MRWHSSGAVRVEVVEKRGSSEFRRMMGLNGGGVANRLGEVFFTTSEGLWFLIGL
jgi:hypothetical protein